MIKKIILSLAIAASVIVSPSPAGAGEPETNVIRVNGYTDWWETIEAINTLRTRYGVPISAYNCNEETTFCITVSHYSARNGQAGYASREGNEAEITFNNYYGKGRGIRMQILYHEFGHVLGLWEHSNRCDAVMQRELAKCGRPVTQYNQIEQEQLREIWSK